MDTTLNGTQQSKETNTTHKKIKKPRPFQIDWQRLLNRLGLERADQKPLPLITILESNGLADAITALKAVKPKYGNAVRLFAAGCAKHVLHIFEEEFPDDQRPRQAIEAAEQYSYGKISLKELHKAHKEAWIAARTANKQSDSFAVREAAYAARDCADEKFEETKHAIDDAAYAIAGSNDENAYHSALNTFLREFRRLALLESKYREITDVDQTVEISVDNWTEAPE